MSRATPPLRSTFPTFVDVLTERAERDPDREALSYLAGGERPGAPLSYAHLSARARAVAVLLRERIPAGGRAVLLFPPGPDFVAAFLGCLFAGVVAVPIFPPDPARLTRTLPRLSSVVRDAEPAAAITSASIAALASEMIALAPDLASLPMIAIDDVGDERADEWRRPAIDARTVAFIQYTSGSTADPRGVVLTHENLLVNLEEARRSFCSHDDPRAVFWLPQYHDMGLIGGILGPIYSRIPAELMSPLDFVQRPVRWLEAITRSRATVSGAPNFAYDLCVRRVTDEELAALDLSSWRVAFCGAEPIRAATIDAFARRFAAAGFARHAFFPCYGLAEATLFVSGGHLADDAGAGVLRVREADLARHAVIDAGAGEPARAIVSCGAVIDDHTVTIVDVATGAPLPDGRVGEICVRGPSVAAGYFRREAESRATFGAPIGPDGAPHLRTGDLGFLRGGALFVTGRAKDVVIVRGKNHYPQDIELTAERAHPALRSGCSAAFPIDTADGDGLAVVVEVARGRAIDPREVASAIEARVAAEHDLAIDRVVLITAGSLPKTSSGKVQRRACKAALAAGALDVVASCERPHGAAKEEPEAEPTAPVSAATVEEWLVERIARVVGQDASEVDVKTPFVRFGLDSMMAVKLGADLGAWTGRALPATVIWDYPTIAALARYVASAPIAPASSGAGR